MVEVERATWEISCRNCDRTKPGKVIPESPQNGFLISRAVVDGVVVGTVFMRSEDQLDRD